MSALAPKLDPDTDIDCIHHPKAPLRLHFNPAPPLCPTPGSSPEGAFWRFLDAIYDVSSCLHSLCLLFPPCVLRSSLESELNIPGAGDR